MGEPDDLPERETVCGLGNHKKRIFREIIEDPGVEVYGCAVVLIRRLNRIGIKTAVVSASTHCSFVLERAGIIDLFDAGIDGAEAKRLELDGRPDPGYLLGGFAAHGYPARKNDNTRRHCRRSRRGKTWSFRPCCRRRPRGPGTVFAEPWSRRSPRGSMQRRCGRRRSLRLFTEGWAVARFLRLRETLPATAKLLSPTVACARNGT